MSPTELYIDKAKNKLQDNKLKLTQARLDLIDLLSEHEEAMTPYKMIDLFKEKGKIYSPITIYRVLDSFMSVNLVHKVYSINSYIRCADLDHTDHDHRLLVCTECNSVMVTPSEQTEAEVNVPGFHSKKIVDEVIGLCGKCH